VTTQYAREKKLPEVGSSSVRLSELGAGPTLGASARYKVTLLNMEGQAVDLIAYGLEHISSNWTQQIRELCNGPSWTSRREGSKELREESAF
jgi:hypothetical protein